MRDPYVRRGRLLRVIDGDTVIALLDMGFWLTNTVHLRLLGLDTPELHDSNPEKRASAEAARIFVKSWFLDHEHAVGLAVAAWPLLIRTEKADSFDRWLADVWCQQEHCLNADLLAGGWAVPFMVAKAQA